MLEDFDIEEDDSPVKTNVLDHEEVQELQGFWMIRITLTLKMNYRWTI